MGTITEKNQPCLSEECGSSDAGVSNKERLNQITQEALQEIFRYEGGNLLWKIAITGRSRVTVGGIAGSLDKSSNYFRVDILGVKYQLHRLIWIYHNGSIPDYTTIDHIDQDTHNNAILNLRLASRSLQRDNSKIRTDNTTGIKGISWHKQSRRFTLQLNIDGKRKYLGRFNTVAEAEVAKAKYNV